MRPAFASCSATLSALFHPHRAFSALTSPFREGDVVLVKQINRPDAAPILSRPLKHDGVIESHKGAIHHRDIVGKLPSQLVQTSTGRAHHLHHPTLAEYVRLTPRLVTPVYPGEANLIVSLLDIHASASDGRDLEDGAGPLEILEAGTGHGSLTLHLARAIHAANVVDVQGSGDSENGATKALKSRNGVVHTLDVSSANSKHAAKIVRDFRRGLYAADVDFHVGTPSGFIAAQMRRRESLSSFLSYAVLDLPGVDGHVEHVYPALHPQGLLAAFCPNVTQLIDCVKVVKRKRLPLFLDRVVELGAGMGAGRPWDLRLIAPKRGRRSDELLVSEAPDSNDEAPSLDRNATGKDTLGNDSIADLDVDTWNVICRPKYGDMSTAGGFLGIWRKVRRD